MKSSILVLSVLCIAQASAEARAAESVTLPIRISAAGSTQATDLDDIKEVVVREVPAPPAAALRLADGISDPILGPIVGMGEGLITFGHKVWDLIKEGKGVSTLELGTPLSVIPQTQTDPLAAFNSMESWSDPKVKAYNVEFRNWRNAVAVSFRYLVSFQYAGTYQGHGRYLHAIAITPADDGQVTWGWSLNANVQHVATANTGTMADPVAGVRIAVNYVVERHALGREYKGSHLIYVKGDGTIEKLDDKQDKPYHE